MKFFDTRAELAKIQNQADPPATSATSATQTAENTPHVAGVASVAVPTSHKQEISAPHDRGLKSDKRHGFALGGRPKTWTGNIVSLDEWRRLSEWEKHGPDGRHWNGKTGQWEHPA